MDVNMLCRLLVQRIDPKQFQLSGLKIEWLDVHRLPAADSPYDTPENRAIVAEVIENYATLAMETLRQRRNALLQECDWTQLSDCPLTPEQRVAWAAYRQALRDLPAATERLTRSTTRMWPPSPGNEMLIPSTASMGELIAPPCACADR